MTRYRARVRRPDPGFRQPSFGQPGFWPSAHGCGDGRRGSQFGIRGRHDRPGPRANAQRSCALGWRTGVGEGRAQGATPLTVWRGFPQDSLSPALKIRPQRRSAARAISAADPVTAQAVGEPERAVRRALPPGNALALDGNDRALANQSGGFGWLDSTQPKA